MPSLGDGETMEEMMKRLGMKPGEGPGQGGTQRGRGDAPLFYGEKEKNLKTNKVENVSNPDLERAIPGEVLAVGETKHDDEQKPSVRQAGGGLSGAAGGGEAVWRDSLLPSEKALLKRYFK